MKTIEEIREITKNVIKEREKESIWACTRFIEDIIEPKILEDAKRGYVHTFVRTNSLVLSQIDYIISVYEEKGYKVKYSTYANDIEICWE